MTPKKPQSRTRGDCNSCLLQKQLISPPKTAHRRSGHVDLGLTILQEPQLTRHDNEELIVFDFVTNARESLNVRQGSGQVFTHTCRQGALITSSVIPHALLNCVFGKFGWTSLCNQDFPCHVSNLGSLRLSVVHGHPLLCMDLRPPLCGKL